MTASPTDPRFQPDAYLNFGGRLYEVVRWEDGTGRLYVRNCLSLETYWLMAPQVFKSELVKAAPDPLMVPAEWEHAHA